MKALAHENGLAYDSTYFHYCNTICPSCHEEMKVINGIVQNVGSIGVGVMEKLGFVVPYAVCVQCNVMNNPKHKRNLKKKRIQIEFWNM